MSICFNFFERTFSCCRGILGAASDKGKKEMRSHQRADISTYHVAEHFQYGQSCAFHHVREYDYSFSAENFFFQSTSTFGSMNLSTNFLLNLLQHEVICDKFICIGNFIK